MTRVLIAIRGTAKRSVSHVPPIHVFPDMLMSDPAVDSGFAQIALIQRFSARYPMTGTWFHGFWGKRGEEEEGLLLFPTLTSHQRPHARHQIDNLALHTGISSAAAAAAKGDFGGAGSGPTDARKEAVLGEDGDGIDEEDGDCGLWKSKVSMDAFQGTHMAMKGALCAPDGTLTEDGVK
ncbi:MAG: hypothetical protein M1818_001404 [Claussenomyces sp. TS43310]|nr:MAG: hypothetical protein M1818_001404 [Claussenomyces sp. TS43310]